MLRFIQHGALALCGCAILAFTACSGGSGASSVSALPKTPHVMRPMTYSAYDMYAPTYGTTQWADCEPGVYYQNGYASYGTFTITQGSGLGTLTDNHDGSASFLRTADGAVTVRWTASWRNYFNEATCTASTTVKSQSWNVP